MRLRRHMVLATLSFALSFAIGVVPVFSQASVSPGQAIKTATELEGQGKWLSAYRALDAADPANAEPWVLAAKIDLCLRGYVRTVYHQAFALVDLEDGQSVESLREDGEEYECFPFDPVLAAAELEKGGMGLPAVLNGALGDYYFAVQDLFPGEWVLSDEEACAAGLARYEAAAKGGVADAGQLKRHAALLVRFSRLGEAEELLRASIALAPRDGEAHFTYALALAQEGRLPEAFGELDLAIANYDKKERRFDACLVGSRFAAESDPARSEAYLAEAEALMPAEPAPALVRHLAAVQLGQAEKAVAAADVAQDRFPGSPYVVRSLLSAWLDAQDLEAALAWLEHAGARKVGKPADLGNIAFYKALLVGQVGGVEALPLAKSILDKAESSFREAYPPDNQVFEAIAELRAKFEKAAAESPAGTPEGGKTASPGAAPTATQGQQAKP